MCNHTKKSGKHCARCPLHVFGLRRKPTSIALPAILTGRRPDEPDAAPINPIPNGMSRRNFLRKMSTVGAVGVGLSVMPK
ncbi:MAG: twin-arginine translocation signal domain-containing protein, partial [Chloroflexota bacterium]